MTQALKMLSIVNLTKRAMHIVESEKLDLPELTNNLQKLLEVAESTTEQDIKALDDMATLLAGGVETPNSVEDAFADMFTLSQGRM